MTPFDLIETARGLTAISRRRPTQANLRRAVSTTYYAVFHCLARTAADLFVGQSRHDRPAWHQVYRALEHGNAKNRCRKKSMIQNFPKEIQDLADTFVTLQDIRHRADYALDGGRYYKSNVIAQIDAAESVIGEFEQTDRLHRLDFVAHVLFKRREP